MVADVVGLSFGILIVVGGVMGFLKSNSTASLISGLVFGALITVTTQYAATHAQGFSLLPATVCLVLGLIMGSRFLESKKFMPAGM
ncbi:Transmembrane protein 14C, partial [Coemansia erecta]